MIFSSLSFIFFFLPLLLIIYFISKEKYRNYILLLFSLLFYSWGEPKYILLMILSIIINYYSALKIDKKINKRSKKLLLIISIILNLSILFYFKYIDFFVSNLNNMFNISLKRIDVILPIGISFYTFQEISYLIDVYKKRIKAQKNIFYLGTYISFFPQLIAGPIVRYKDIEKQLLNRNCTFDKFCNGARRFIIGLGKKVLIANNVSYIVDCIFNSTSLTDYGIVIIITGLVSFTIQLYYDFSGYSDMAIGLSRLFGFELIENFNYPYSATSIRDFWKRWHISLSSWFKDYVYIPLGGSRVSKLKYVRNIFVVWILTGIWHGASWNYIIWGLYYAILLLLEKKLSKNIKRIPIFIRWLITFILINIGWLIFKIENLNKLKKVIINIITLKKSNILEFLWNNFSITNYLLFLIIGLIFMFPIINNLKKYKDKYIYCLIRDLVISIIFILSICSLISNNYNPFLYFRF